MTIRSNKQTNRDHSVARATIGRSLAVPCMGLLAIVFATGRLMAQEAPAEKEPAKETAKETTEKFQFVAVEDFDGKLRLDWQPVRLDPTHYSLSKKPGKLTITTQRGSIHGDETNDQFGEGLQARNLFLFANPLSRDTDFVVTTCVSDFAPTTAYQQAGLIIYNDDDNYLKWGYEFNGRINEGNGFVLVRETDGEPSHDVGPGGWDGVQKKCWLRLTKRGNRYTHSTSEDGVKFTDHGEREWGDGGPKKIGILAKNGGNKAAAEIDASFEFFDIRAPAPAKEKGDTPAAPARAPAPTIPRNEFKTK